MRVTQQILTPGQSCSTPEPSCPPPLPQESPPGSPVRSEPQDSARRNGARGDVTNVSVEGLTFRLLLVSSRGFFENLGCLWCFLKEGGRKKVLG